jgi:hypothetical protein
MDRIEVLLSHDDYYWLSPIIRKAKSLPGAPADVAERARTIFVSFGGSVSDYAVRDYYEMVRDYYRPRVRVYIQALRELLNLNQRQIVPSDQLDNKYAAIEDSWLKNGFPLLDGHPDRARVIDTVKDILGTFPPTSRKAEL